MKVYCSDLPCLSQKPEKNLKQIFLNDKEKLWFWVMCIYKGDYCKQDCNPDPFVHFHFPGPRNKIIRTFTSFSK